jgi:Outer membrane protein
MTLADDNAHGGAAEDREFLEAIMRYQDGTLDPDGVRKLGEQIRSNPAKRAVFRKIQWRTAAIHDLLRIDAFGRSSQLMDEKSDATSSAGSEGIPSSGRRIARSIQSAFRWGGGLALGLTLAAGIWFFNQPGPSPELAEVASTAPVRSSVLLDEMKQAKFSLTTPLSIGEGVVLQNDYILKSGMVKLKFPNGATTILEGPSIFNVANEEQLILKSGGCSVHAPPGAEGFEVLTPLTKVVDRGTRFYVNVRDNSETEVHVVEGAADLYAGESFVDSSSSSDTLNHETEELKAVRLGDGEAVRLGGFAPKPGIPTRFNPEKYRGQIPDRLIGYQASSLSNGSADELISLTVQRNGQVWTYSFEDLIPIDVTSFRADPGPEPNGYLCGYEKVPPFPGDALNDRKLVTGLINFGGGVSPLTNRALHPNDYADVSSRPPGLGIRFRTPIVNHPGPDLVVFEIQSPVNLADGDPFHIYPVSDREDLRPMTVTKYDLTIDSGGVRKVLPVWSQRYAYEAKSIEDIQGLEAQVKVEVGHLHFHVIAVGIDLSEMGYSDGELVEELFLQHASEVDGPKVDPTMIVGLPPLPET